MCPEHVVISLYKVSYIGRLLGFRWTKVIKKGWSESSRVPLCDNGCLKRTKNWIRTARY